jgi:hypothetical protein
MGIKVTGTYLKPLFRMHIENLFNNENREKVEKVLDKIDKNIPGAGEFLKKLF